MRKHSSRLIPLITTSVVAMSALLTLTAPALAGPLRQVVASAVPITTATPPPNDNCAGAIVIPCGSFNISGDTSNANNDYTFPTDASSCTGFTADGRDVVYKMNIMVGDSIWVDFASSTTDGSIYIVTNCNDVAGSCVVGEDSTDVGGKETLRYKFTTAGTYYLIIDSFGANVGGPWSATGQLLCAILPPPPANDRCTNATPLACGPFTLSGTTEFATNDYEFPTTGSSCFGSKADGKDVCYKLTVTAGDSLWVDYTSSADGAIYVVADCLDLVNTCVVGADVAGVGAAEHLRYRFTFSGTYYLIMDSKGAGSFGTWSANGSQVCGEAPTNDICERAIALACGNFSLSGNTLLALDDYTFNTDAESCTGYRAAGHDVVYKVYATAGDSLWIDYTSQADGSIYVAYDCNNVTLSCIAGADQNGVGETEYLRCKFPQTKTYYIFIDSFGANTWGLWTAVGRMICATSGVQPDAQPPVLELGAIRPNPFRISTSIPFSIPAQGRVALRLMDLQGRVVRTLVDGDLAAGPHQMSWDGRDDRSELVRAGVYFVKLSGSGGEAVRRAIFVR